MLIKNYNDFMNDHHKDMEWSAIKAILAKEEILNELSRVYKVDLSNIDAIKILHASPEADMYLKVDFVISFKDNVDEINCQLKLKSLKYIRYNDLRTSNLEVNHLRSVVENRVHITACLSGDYNEMSCVNDTDILTCCGLMITKDWNPFNQSYNNRLLNRCDIAYDDVVRDQDNFLYEVANPKKHYSNERYRRYVDYISNDCYSYKLTKDQYGNSFQHKDIASYRLRCLSKKDNKIFLAIPVIGIAEHLKKIGVNSFAEHVFFFDFRR